VEKVSVEVVERSWEEGGEWSEVCGEGVGEYERREWRGECGEGGCGVV
jgi:hypothetical protein